MKGRSIRETERNGNEKYQMSITRERRLLARRDKWGTLLTGKAVTPVPRLAKQTPKETTGQGQVGKLTIGQLVKP